MELPDAKVIRYDSRKYEWKFTPLGDQHIGNAGCDEEAFRADVARIAADPDHYTILMGDACDCIAQDDPRWDAKEIAEWLYDHEKRQQISLAQRDRFLEMIDPIPADRILGVHEGNHERRIRNHHYMDMTLDFARKKGIPYLGDTAITQVVFRRGTNGRGASSRVFDIFSTHGAGGGRKTGGKVNRIQDLAGWAEADIYLMGHVHERMGFKDVLLKRNKRGKLVKHERGFAITGTYLKTYGEGSLGYGARALYKPTSIGPVTIRIRPHTREMRVET